MYPRPTRGNGRGPTRRTVLACGVGLVGAALAGCGDAGSSSPSPTPGSPSGTRQVTDSLGRKVTVPTRPQRIVSLQDWANGMAVLSLGGSLTGMVTREGGKFIDSVAKQFDLSQVKPVGMAGEWNLEQIAALKPDLILGSAWEHKPNVENYDPEKLQAIGPTYFIEDGQTTLDEYMRTIGELIGRQDEVERQRKEYEAAAAKARAQLEKDAKGLSFADVGWGDPTFYVATPASPHPLVKVGLQIGLKLPKAAAVPGKKRSDYLELSSEQIAQGSADLLYYTNDEWSPVKLPLWSRLPAVRAGQAIAMDLAPIGWTYHEYNRALDILGKSLATARKVTAG